MTDHVLESARCLITESLKELRTAAYGLPIGALNWRPTPETNSIAVLTAHTMGAARRWVRMALGITVAGHVRYDAVAIGGSRVSFPPAGLPLTECARQMRRRLRQVLEAQR